MWPFHYNNMFFMQQRQEQMMFANHLISGSPPFFPMVPIANERPRQLTSVEIKNIQPKIVNKINEIKSLDPTKNTKQEINNNPQETKNTPKEKMEMELMEEETAKARNVLGGNNAFKQLNLINKPNIMSKPSPVKVQPVIQTTEPINTPSPFKETRFTAQSIPTIFSAAKTTKAPTQPQTPPQMPSQMPSQMPLQTPSQMPSQTVNSAHQVGTAPRIYTGWPLMGLQPSGQPQQFSDKKTYEYKPTASAPMESPSFVNENPEKIINPNSWDLAAESSGDESDDLKRKGSVFSRLGPISEQKRAKLTINLLYNKDETIRDVVEENKVSEEFLPVTQRKDITLSTDETVMKFFPLWPWSRSMHRKPKEKDKTILDLQSLEIAYVDNLFFKICVTGYPPHYKKEDVLDILVQTLKDKSFVPCFIEFNPTECLFLTIRSKKSLISLFKMGLKINQDDFVMTITIRKSFIGLSHLDFIPRLIVRRRIILSTDEDLKADLSAFCLQPDISHFIYFPLNYLGNQVELIHIHATNFNNLVELNLSNNRLTTILGFNLSVNAPKLHVLNLSNNYLSKFGELIDCKGLLLRSLTLEGNPFCLDFIHPREYTECAKLLFPTLKKLDGVRIQGRCELAVPKRNRCPPDALHIVDTLLDTYFPLLEETEGNRLLIADLYDKNALYSVNCKKRLQEHSHARTLFRMLMRSGDGCLEGSDNIARYISKWPQIKHDPESFKTYVMYHSDKTTIVTIDGVLKVPSSSLAEDEPMVVFSRTLVLHNKFGSRYHIRNEIVNWDLPTDRTALAAFVTTARPKKTSLQLESPDEDLKKELTDIFSKITNTEPLFSEQCLLKKKWDLTEALHYYMNIVRSSM